MNLKVKLLDQSVHELDVEPATLISDLKAVLEATLNVPVDRQRLIYRGRVLRDENTLQELGVENGHTIHLVQRPADTQETRPQQPNAPAGMDLDRLLQGVFSALGGAAQAAAQPQQQQQQPAPPHLLQSLAEYLQELSSPASGSSFPVMPVTSLAPGASATGGLLQQSLASALQQILQGQNLTPEQQAQLHQASTVTGAPGMQVVLAALSVLVSRAQTFLSGPFAASLATSAQQLAQAGHTQAPPTAAVEFLASTSGQLQAAAALLVELARAVSAASLAAQGNPIALTQNMAAVLRERSGGGLEASFPTLYPQTSLGARASSRSAPAATGAQRQQHPSGQQIAEMVASALSTSLAPVIQQVSAEVENAVRTGRSQVASGQFEAAATAARTAATSHVSSTVSRVLNTVTDAINTNVRSIEQRLQQIEQQAGREATAADIASAVQQVLLPDLNLEPLGHAIGAAARAAASSTTAAAAAVRAAQAAQEAAAAAGAQAAAAAAAATPAAAPAPSAPPAAAAAGPSSNSGSRQQPQGMGLGLKTGALPAKRKAAGTPPAAAGGASSATAAGEAGEGGVSARGSSAFAGASRAPHSNGSGAAQGPLARKPTPGTLRLSETGRASPHPGSPHLNPVTEAAEDMDGVERQQRQQRQQPPPPDMAALMQMMGGMLGGAAGGGAPTSAATASMSQRTPAAAMPRSAGQAGAAGAGDLGGLMQMVGGMLGGPGATAGGAAGGGGGMAGLLQMAGQIASDPAMQPMMNSIASSLLGGGGGAGGAGGLGSLLSGLLGGPPPGGVGAVGSGNRGSATVVVGLDDLEHELPADTAAQWRRTLEEDARAQARMLAQGRGPLSEVYLAGAPAKKQSLVNLIPGSG